MVYHVPVLLQSVLHYLNVRPGKKYIDATFGGGGHSTAILSAGGLVLGIDQDPEAISACPPLDHLQLVRGNFTHLAQIAHRFSWVPVSGILYDLGVSSWQINNPGRGFSFQKDGPLDMRMDPDLMHNAATLINHLNVPQLARIFDMFGEIPSATAVAKKIVQTRPFTSTVALAEVLGDKHTRRRVFQALRIAVNDELTSLSVSLPQAYDLLEPSGRLAVISFHSLEDRIVKNTYRLWSSQKKGTIITSSPVVPGREEIAANSRSHSAKLRVFQKK